MKQKYSVQYKNGATVTVFAPYDCENHCPFCVNKKDYQDDPDFDLNAVMQQMYKIGCVTPNCDFVITGGEPFADLGKLETLLYRISSMNTFANHHHKVFVNTTLPVGKYSEDELIDFINSHDAVITGLNVSRHIKSYVKECDDSIFDKIKIPVRINTVLYKPEEAKSAKEHWKRFAGRASVVGMQFREDYTQTTQDNLYTFDVNGTFSAVCSSFGSEEKSEMIFANDFRWNAKIIDNVSYHRTLPYSTIKLEDGSYEINDIIITPQGKMLDDWNNYGKELDLEAYAELYV